MGGGANSSRIEVILNIDRRVKNENKKILLDVMHHACSSFWQYQRSGAGK